MGKISTADKSQTRRQSQFSGDFETNSEGFLECKPPKRLRQLSDTQDGLQLFACPFAKYDPSAVPRSCFLGWQSIARLKYDLRAFSPLAVPANRTNREHLSRRHRRSSASTYSKRSTSSTSCSHTGPNSAGAPRCATCKVDGPWLSEGASRMLRCRSPDAPKTWTQIYETIYPNATMVPSPCQ